VVPEIPGDPVVKEGLVIISDAEAEASDEPEFEVESITLVD